MKKITFFLVISFVLILMAGCNGKTTTSPTTTSATTVNTTTTTTILTTGTTTTDYVLQQPTNIVVEDNIITWNTVQNATSYVVKIGDTETPSLTTSFPVPDSVYGSTSISVKAIDATHESAYSEIYLTIIVKTLSYPENIIQTDNVISWDEVTFAIGYVIKINGVEYFTYDTEYEVDINVASNIQVLAVGDTETYLESSVYSLVLQIKVPLVAVTNIRFESGVLTWDVVLHADSYILVLNDDEAARLLSTNTFSEVSGYSGEVNVKVIAHDTSDTYLNSVVSEAVVMFPEITLGIVINLEIIDDTLHFDLVNLADSYDIYLNGEYYVNVETNSYLIPQIILDDETSYLQVMAKSEIHHSSPLSEKKYVSVEIITTYEELLLITSNGSYELGNNIEATGSWTPIDFSGYFNGNGYEISNLLIDTAYENTGFFGLLNEATVLSLILSGTINIDSDIYQISVGALAGKVTYSIISDIDIDFDIDVDSANGIGNVGGVFGVLENTFIDNIHYMGDITAHNMITGGFVGTSSNPEINSRIERSSVYTTITVSGGLESFAGGFIGKFTNNMLEINTSYANIILQGASYVGGFVGYMGSGTITNCYSYGPVEATNNDFVHLGGFIGHVEGYNVSISKSYTVAQLYTDATGIEVYVGSFSGKTPGGTIANIYANCYYDRLTSTLDRIGNTVTGRGDGITGVNILSLTGLTGFDPSIWDFSGPYPILIWNYE